MNSVVLIGRLARDVELSYTPNSQMAVAKFTLAVDRPRTKAGGDEPTADFIRVTVFGRQAENCDRYLSKGRQTAIHGRIQTGSYKSREGVTVYTTDVIADRVEFLGGGQSSQAQTAGGSAASPSQERQAPVQEDFGGFDDLPDTFQDAEDDVPF